MSLSFDISSAGSSSNMAMWKTNSGWFQLFIYQNRQFLNVKNNRAIEVVNSKDDEGANVGIGDRADRPNQRWNVIYLDEAADEPTSGLNKDFGFWINRPFYIVSELPMHRVIEVIGAKALVIKSKVYDKKEQRFFFD
jgi:hypothetical protein